MVARVGGDEFAILLNTDSQLTLGLECQRIREAVNEYNQNNPPVPLSVSVGSSFRNDKSGDIREMYITADDGMYREKLDRSQNIRNDMVRNLMNTLQAREIVNEERSRRFEDIFMSFAMYIGFAQSKISDLRLFARFHNIGKVGLSDQILASPHPLNPEYRRDVEKHCEIGYRIARSSSDLLPIANWIMHHHEWWDGGGYPLGLAKTNIPLECRVLSIVRAFDEMTSDQLHRPAIGADSAIEEIKNKIGTQFDPYVADAFIRWFQTSGVSNQL